MRLGDRRGRGLRLKGLLLIFLVYLYLLALSQSCFHFRPARGVSHSFTMYWLSTYMFMAAGVMQSSSFARAAQIPPELSQYFHTRENLIASFANGTYNITQPAQVIPKAGMSTHRDIHYAQTNPLQTPR